MVMKAVQQVRFRPDPSSRVLLTDSDADSVAQLLFDVDWTSSTGTGTDDLDVLVIDMPPGTGDVQLSLGQLVAVDGMSHDRRPQW